MASTRFPTRILLTAAAIGAAGGIYVAALNLIGLATAIAYFIYAATIALWALPVLVAQALLKRPGIALLTALIMALINAAVTPNGVAQLQNFVVVGILIELPFLITLYRTWSTRMFWIAHPISSFLVGIVYLLFVYLAAPDMPAWQIVVAVVGAAISAVVVTAAAQLIVGRLRKAGLGRERSVPQPAPAAVDSPSDVTAPIA